MRLVSWAATHRGSVRKTNQDACLARPEIGLWAVADGAGGHQAGEVASAAVIAALGKAEAAADDAALAASVRRLMDEAHAALRAEAARRGADALVASTVVALVAAGARYRCLWAGDSRIYRLRGGELRQLTRDHSLVQDMVDAGVLMPEQAERHPRANVITRAIGIDGETVTLDEAAGEILAGDRFLLCSDGLTKALDAARIAALLAGTGDGASPAERLVAAALERGASDNVTAVAVAAG
ncbi:MAG: serine/threonine-protein phosphatase [Proteobacteria bacterium]|nr:serine/threonine-protein phosphatase [Pseudomonadota bacterium]